MKISRLALFAASVHSGEGENTLSVWTPRSLTNLDSEESLPSPSGKKKISMNKQHILSVSVQGIWLEIIRGHARAYPMTDQPLNSTDLHCTIFFIATGLHNLAWSWFILMIYSYNPKQIVISWFQLLRVSGTPLMSRDLFGTFSNHNCDNAQFT